MLLMQLNTLLYQTKTPGVPTERCSSYSFVFLPTRCSYGTFLIFKNQNCSVGTLLILKTGIVL
jgi:hypothetical protein